MRIGMGLGSRQQVDRVKRFADKVCCTGLACLFHRGLGIICSCDDNDWKFMNMRQV